MEDELLRAIPILEQYEPFFADFGPLNMGCAYRFCERALAALEEAAKPPCRRAYFCTTGDAHRKTNAAVLVGQLCVLHLGRSADEAYRPLLPLKPFAPFRDASCGPSTYHLTVLDCLRGCQRARDAGLLDFQSAPKPLLPTTAPPSPRPPPSPGSYGGPAPPPAPSGGGFDSEVYEHYERVENGDLNWVVPGKLVAFSGPHGRKATWAGYHSLTPEDYWAPFRSFGVTAVVRLNKRLYDRRRFTEGGFRHHELFFPDGSCPTTALVERFCALVEAEPGVVAVHCKAGLGRTGVLIGLFLMKHFSFTANEALGYLRLVRPGSVIGPQQHFLRDWERRMHVAGEAYRSGAGPRPVRLAAPRKSFGGGGEYDDGDISDEDADPGDEAEAAYDDGGYTTNRAVAAANAAANAAASAAAAAAAAAPAPAQPVLAPAPYSQQTSPTKAGHSGTVARMGPSLAQGGGVATMPLPGDGAARAYARSVAEAAAAAGRGSAGTSPHRPHPAQPPLVQARSGGGGGDVAGGAAHAPLRRTASQQLPPVAAAPPQPQPGPTGPSVVERLRRSVMGAAAPAGGDAAAAGSGGGAPAAVVNGLRSSTGPLFRSLPPGADLAGEAGLARAISGLAHAQPQGVAASTSVRLVNAAGQPRKVAAPVANTLYGNAYRAGAQPSRDAAAPPPVPQLQALDISASR